MKLRLTLAIIITSSFLGVSTASATIYNCSGTTADNESGTISYDDVASTATFNKTLVMKTYPAPNEPNLVTTKAINQPNKPPYYFTIEVTNPNSLTLRKYNVADNELMEEITTNCQ